MLDLIIEFLKARRVTFPRCFVQAQHLIQFKKDSLNKLLEFVKWILLNV